MDTTRCIEKTGTRAQKCFSGVASAETTIFYTCSERISTLNRCLVQPEAVTSNGNQVSHRSLGLMHHYMLTDSYPAPVGHSSARLTSSA